MELTNSDWLTPCFWNLATNFICMSRSNGRMVWITTALLQSSKTLTGSVSQKRVRWFELAYKNQKVSRAFGVNFCTSLHVLLQARNGHCKNNVHHLHSAPPTLLGLFQLRVQCISRTKHRIDSRELCIRVNVPLNKGGGEQRYFYGMHSRWMSVLCVYHELKAFLP